MPDNATALIDGYLLDGSPPRSEVIARLLAVPPSPQARPFYDGFRILGARTPDLSLIALRLVLAGRRADDSAVTALRAVIERVRAGGPQARAARSEYRRMLGD